MPTFPVLLIEGAFYIDTDGRFVATTGDRVVSVDDALDAFEGKHVRIALHHLPVGSPRPLQWGGGSCAWQSTGVCPAGHHERPMWLYNVSEEGFLTRSGPTTWRLERLDGQIVVIDAGQNLLGHSGRVLVAQVATVTEMRDILAESGGHDLVEGLSARADDLRALLSQYKGQDNG